MELRHILRTIDLARVAGISVQQVRNYPRTRSRSKRAGQQTRALRFLLRSHLPPWIRTLW